MYMRKHYNSKRNYFYWNLLYNSKLYMEDEENQVMGKLKKKKKLEKKLRN